MCRFNVGDRVTFKTKEQIAAMCGGKFERLNKPVDGNIYFVEHMEFLCGTSATVEQINPSGCVLLKDFDAKQDASRYIINQWMLQ